MNMDENVRVSTGKFGRIGRHLAEKPDVRVTMYFGPMPPDASDFPGGIPACIRSVSSYLRNADSGT